jgi:hypothetical protein
MDSEDGPGKDRADYLKWLRCEDCIFRVSDDTHVPVAPVPTLPYSNTRWDDCVAKIFFRGNIWNRRV